MCDTTTKEKLKDKVEFCENFRASVVEKFLHPFIKIYNNTQRRADFSTNLFTGRKEEEIEKLLKANKILCLSGKTLSILYELYAVRIENINILNKNIGGIYVEYFQDKFWITNFKGYRMPLKLGKLLKAITDLNDKEISDIVDKYNRYIAYDISGIQVTEDIEDVYNYSHVNGGSIGGSCMRGNGDFYESLQNSAEDLQIAYLLDENNDGFLIGRALLWVAYDINDKPYKIMDRIYYDCERTKVLFEKYAEANGYYFRKESSGYCTYFYDTKNKQWIELYLYVKLRESLMETQTPYMDTFREYDGGRVIRNFDSGEYPLTSTDGTAVYKKCAYCGGVITTDDYTYSSYHDINICESCIADYRYVEHLDDYIHYDCCIQIRGTDTFIHEDYLDECGVRYAKDDGYYDYEDNLYYAEDTGNYYANSSSLYYAEDTGKLYEDVDFFYYTEDTNEYYAYCGNLYEYDGVYYTERQENLEEKEKEKDNENI